MSDHLIVIAQARAKSGSIEALVAAQRKLVAATRLAPGCIQYDLHVSTNEPDVVLFVETWESEDAWNRHMRSQAIEEFRRTGGHLIGQFSLQTYRKIA
jgi:quinol monooxygenase YgiN